MIPHKTRQAPLTEALKRKVKRDFLAICIFGVIAIPFAYFYVFAPGGEKDEILTLVQLVMGSFFLFILIYMIRIYYKAAMAREVTIFSGYVLEKSQYANTIGNGKVNSTNPIKFRILLQDQYFFLDARMYNEIKIGDHIELTGISKDHILKLEVIENNN